MSNRRGGGGEGRRYGGEEVRPRALRQEPPPEAPSGPPVGARLAVASATKFSNQSFHELMTATVFREVSA